MRDRRASTGLAMLILGASLALGACAPRARTEVLVVVEAEASIARDATTLHVRVEGGGEPLVERLVQTIGSTSEPVAFPITLGIVPSGGDPSRRFRVEATASTASGLAIGTVRVLSGFVEGRTLVLRLVLDEACRGAACPEACRGGVCVPAEVDPRTLPETEGDAGLDAARTSLDASVSPDASSPPDAWSAVDAWTRIDAGRPLDARLPTDSPASLDSPTPLDAVMPDAFSPVCTGDCRTLPLGSGLGRGITFAAPFDFDRPVAGACPSPRSGLRTSWAAMRLYNPTSSSQSVELNTSRCDVDSMLFVYAEPMPRLGSPASPPADATDCLLALDETVDVAPHVHTTVSVPAGQAILVVVTTAAAGEAAHCQLDLF